MRIEQAIFTSVRSERLDGYQLAARSPGVTDDLAKELTTWGPAHDSMWNTAPGATSINFHPLADGRFCISHTALAGAEYSGRGGGRVYTQMLVVGREGLERFGGDPFLILRALAAGGRTFVHGDVPVALPTIPLIGRVAEFKADWAPKVLELAGPEVIAEVTEAVTSTTAVSVITDLPVERLFQVLLRQLSLAERMTVSFTTGLKPSSRRPFKLSMVPDDPALARQSQRMNQGRVIEVLSPEPAERSSHRLTVGSTR